MMAYAAIMMAPYLIWSTFYRQQVEQFLQFLMSGMEEGLTVTIAGIAGVEFAGGKAAEPIIDKNKIQPVFDPDTVPAEPEPEPESEPEAEAKEEETQEEDQVENETEETGFIESKSEQPIEMAVEEITIEPTVNENTNNSIRSSRLSKRGVGPPTKEQLYEEKLNEKLTQHFKDRK